MTGRTHDLAAFTVFTAYVLTFPPHDITLATGALAVLANLMGGVAPDIDQPTAPLWRNLPIGKYFGRVFDNFTGGHRFLTHSLLGLALFGFAAHWLLLFFQPVMHTVDIDFVWVAFMIGMVSHLVMDSFTKEGVPWLLPIPWKFGFPPVKHLRITTGKFTENWLVFPLLIGVNALLLASHHQLILKLLHSVH